jgi:hypothetical protein
MIPITTLRWNAPGGWACSGMASMCVASVPAAAAARIMIKSSSDETEDGARHQLRISHLMLVGLS